MNKENRSEYRILRTLLKERMKKEDINKTTRRTILQDFKTICMRKQEPSFAVAIFAAISGHIEKDEAINIMEMLDLDLKHLRFHTRCDAGVQFLVDLYARML